MLANLYRRAGIIIFFSRPCLGLELYGHFTVHVHMNILPIQEPLDSPLFC